MSTTNDSVGAKFAYCCLMLVSDLRYSWLEIIDLAGLNLKMYQAISGVRISISATKNVRKLIVNNKLISSFSLPSPSPISLSYTHSVTPILLAHQ